MQKGADIKKKRLELTGHVVRLDQGGTAEKIFQSKPEEVEDSWRMWRRIYGRRRLNMATDVSRQGRMGVRN